MQEHKTLSWPDGSKYEGECWGSKRQGHGEMMFADGGKYSGGWMDDKMQGPSGTYEWPSGARYVGSWLNGKRIGRGEYTFPGGGRYNGDWRDDCMSGQGELTTASGTIIRGTWRRNSFVPPPYKVYYITLVCMLHLFLYSTGGLPFPALVLLSLALLSGALLFPDASAEAAVYVPERVARAHGVVSTVLGKVRRLAAEARHRSTEQPEPERAR